MADQDNGERDGRQVIARLADDLLPVLIARLEASGLGELEVRQDGWRIRLRWPPQANGATPLPSGARGQPASPGTAQATEARQPASRAGHDRGLLTSPAVGYFSPRDDLKVGAVLGAGDVIGHIDVLGVGQEVVVAEAGTLARLDVETGQAVEYGQPIARVEPEAHG